MAPWWADGRLRWRVWLRGRPGTFAGHPQLSCLTLTGPRAAVLAHAAGVRAGGSPGVLPTVGAVVAWRGQVRSADIALGSAAAQVLIVVVTVCAGADPVWWQGLIVGGWVGWAIGAWHDLLRARPWRYR